MAPKESSLRKTLFIVVVALFSIACPAEVSDSAANGFTVRLTTLIQVAPETVYDRLVHHVGDWWNSEHTYSNDAHNLSIDDKPLGCFCEKLPYGGGVRHAQVITVMPNKLLVMSGALGPLQKFGTTGTLTVLLEPMHKDTRIQLIYAVGGYLPDGLNTWAVPVDKMLGEQLARLKSYVETGNPVAAGDKH
jgi:uncharacterized protein YndB with AHSA1/START domain